MENNDDSPQGMTPDELQKAIKRHNDEAIRMAKCPRHFFDVPQGIADLSPDLLAGYRIQCKHCKGSLSLPQARQYALGYAAGAGVDPQTILRGLGPLRPQDAAPMTNRGLARLWGALRRNEQ